MAWQIEWFASKSGTTIGTLAKGKIATGWDYAVLEREQTGSFRVRKLGGDAFSIDDARADLLLEMAAAERNKSGLSRVQRPSDETAELNPSIKDQE